MDNLWYSEVGSLPTLLFVVFFVIDRRPVSIGAYFRHGTHANSIPIYFFHIDLGILPRQQILGLVRKYDVLFNFRLKDRRRIATFFNGARIELALHPILCKRYVYHGLISIVAPEQVTLYGDKT